MNDTTYWGVLCRTCRELVAFDIAPYPSFGPNAANMKPGAIRCAKSHNHIYFPGDFQFLSSEVAIPDAVMEQNRIAYGEVNPYSPLYAEPKAPQRVEPEPVPAAKLVNSYEPDPSLVADPRRQVAQMAAKNRWAAWALKKTS